MKRKFDENFDYGTLHMISNERHFRVKVKTRVRDEFAMKMSNTEVIGKQREREKIYNETFIIPHVNYRKFYANYIKELVLCP